MARATRHDWVFLAKPRYARLCQELLGDLSVKQESNSAMEKIDRNHQTLTDLTEMRLTWGGKVSAESSFRLDSEFSK